MSKRILFAVGMVAVSAGTASAQFANPYAPLGPSSYGGVFTTPNGGVVQQQGYTTPFSSYQSSVYANPYTGGYSSSQSYMPNYSVYSYNPIIIPRFYTNPYSAPVFGPPGFGYSGFPTMNPIANVGYYGRMRR